MAKTSSTKTPRSTKKTPVAATVPAESLVLNHTETVTGDAGEDALTALIASLDMPASDEVFEPAVTAAAIDTGVLDAAVSGVEAIEATMLSATPDGVVDAGAVPTGDASDVVDAPVEKVKKAAVPRKHYSDKTERLKDRVGTGLSEYSILTLADAGVTDEQLVAKMEETMTIIKSMNGKSQAWAVKFIEFLAGKKASLSEVTGRILKLLHTDGHITTGNEGNMFKDLVARPYSPGAARAMGGNNLAMLAHLKVIQADGKGRYVANPDSLLLMKVNSMIFAGSPEAAEEDAALAAA